MERVPGKQPHLRSAAEGGPARLAGHALGRQHTHGAPHGLGLSSTTLWRGPSLASPLQNTFRTPVYTTSMRRNAMGVGLVFEADLFTAKHISHWVLQGVCLTLNSD